MLSDEAAADYKRRPITTLAERVTVVEACRYVDEVVPAAPLRPRTGGLSTSAILERIRTRQRQPHSRTS